MRITAQLCDVSGEPLPYEWNRVQGEIDLDALAEHFNISRKGSDLFAGKNGRWSATIGRIVAGDETHFSKVRFTDDDGRIITLDNADERFLEPGWAVDIEYIVEMDTLSGRPSPRVPIGYDRSPLLHYLKPPDHEQDAIWDAVKRFSRG